MINSLSKHLLQPEVLAISLRIRKIVWLTSYCFTFIVIRFFEKMMSLIVFQVIHRLAGQIPKG